MRGTRKYLRNRQVECLARDLLREMGYVVVRSAGDHAPVDLVAWKEDGTLLLLMTARTRRSIDEGRDSLTGRFCQEVQTLRRLPRHPGLAVQFWVYFDRQGWRFFEIHPGGVMEVEA